MKKYDILILCILLFSSLVLSAHEGEHSRITESCILGNLPKELQFVEQGNPVYLSGDTLNIENVRLFAQMLDGRLKNLFRKAVGEAKKATDLNGKKKFDENYLKELAFQLYLHSKDEFDVSFCGDAEIVDSFLYAQIFDYLNSSTRSDVGIPDWVARLDVDIREFRNLVVVTALGLYLSGEIHNDYLVLFEQAKSGAPQINENLENLGHPQF